MSQDGSPDVAKGGSIKRTEGPAGEDGEDETWRYALKNLRYSVETFWLRQRTNAWTLVQISGFATFLFGAFRLFGIGVFGMDGLGPLPRGFFRTVYLPGPWSTVNTTWELAFLWMGIGIAIVGLSTRRWRPGL